MKRFLILTILLFVSSFASADSFTMNNIANFEAIGGYDYVVTPMTPGVDIYLAALHLPGGWANFGRFWSTLDFEADFTSSVTNASMTWTLTLPSPAAPMVVTFPPFTCAPGPGCDQRWEFVIPTNLYYTHFNPASLAVNLNGTVTTFPFHFIVLVPEPTSLLLLGTGLIGIGWGKYKKFKTSFAAPWFARH